MRGLVGALGVGEAKMKVVSCLPLGLCYPHIPLWTPYPIWPAGGSAGLKMSLSGGVRTVRPASPGQVALQDLSLTQTVVGRITAPKDVHVPTPRIWNLLPCVYSESPWVGGGTQPCEHLGLATEPSDRL